MTSSPEEKPSLLSLPYDLLFSCVARLSRLYYPTLSLVSKRFRSLLVSPELYKVRSLLGRTESCLYVHFMFDLSWFTLCRKPDHRSLPNDNDTKSSGFVLAKVPTPHSRHPRYASLVTVGSDIYHIGGYIDVGVTSSRVSILDCRSHTWHEGPSMRVELITYSASVVDQKIYVVGSNKDGDLLEALDTNNQTWDHVSVPIPSDINLDIRAKSACLDGKFHLLSVFDKDTVSYDSKDGRWNPVGPEISHYMHLGSHCEIENVLYISFGGEFKWYDTKLRMWSDLMGLEGLPELSPHAWVSLADYGGKMAVLWVENLSDDCGLPGEENKNKVWCAEITLERRKCGEIWGTVDWFDDVLTIPGPCHYNLEVLALAATL